MFYSVFYQPKANFSLREDKKMKIVGYLVRIGSSFELVEPIQHTNYKGKKQFSFVHNNDYHIAQQMPNGVWTANKS